MPCKFSSNKTTERRNSPWQSVRTLMTEARVGVLSRFANSSATAFQTKNTNTFAIHTTTKNVTTIKITDKQKCRAFSRPAIFLHYSAFSSAAGAASLKHTSPFSRTHSYLCFAATEPSRICSESLSSTLVWIARRRGLAP